MKIKHLIPLLITLVVMSLAANSFAENYSALRQDYQQLMKSAQLQRQRSNWEKMISRFDRFIEQQPRAKEIEKAVFLAARTRDGLSRASGRSADAHDAIQHYLIMAKRFPGSRLADDALFLAGQLAEQQLKDQKMAYQLYQQLVTQLPAGDMRRDALKKLTVLPKPAVKSPPVMFPQQNHQDIGESIQLEKVRFWSGPEYTRIVLDLTAPVVAKPHYLKGENPRLYFDLLYTKTTKNLRSVVPIGNGLVKQVRVSQFDAQRSRVVIDLNNVSEYKMVALEKPYRLVIDINGAPSRSVISAPDKGSQRRGGGDNSIASILSSSADQQVVLHVPQKTHDEGIHLIVVDAGHGGKDPGAIGPHNVYEKSVTLAMAKVLAKELRKQLGVKVLLTRSDDRYLTLQERTQYANQVGADLFISLHANATSNGKAYGVETYFLNLSKNNQAAEVAARENGTSLQEVGNLEAILFDLMANAKINESSRLAAEVQQSIVSGLRPHYSHIRDLGVKQGPFHVLLGATMPSILIESGFISNKREVKRLKSSKYQQRVAAAIVKGVKEYSATIKRTAQR